MSAVRSLVQELANAGFCEGRCFDLRVPEGTEAPYTWCGLAGTQDYDVLCADDADPFITFVDIEVWGAEGTDDAQAIAEQMRTFLRTTKPGAYGSGRVVGIQVSDQRDEYELRNPAGDEFEIGGTLSIGMVQYKES